METETRSSLGVFPVKLASWLLEPKGDFEVVPDGEDEDLHQDPDLPDGCFARPQQGLESWCIDPTFRPEFLQACVVATEIMVRPYPMCKIRRSVLPFRPKTYGVGTMEMESLGGYFLRLAERNKLVPTTLARTIWPVLPVDEIRSNGGWLAVLVAASQGILDLDPLEGAVRVASRSLDCHTLMPIFRYFSLNQDLKPSRSELIKFIGGSEFRICPLCLRALDPYYRLAWTIPEITVCMHHGVYLRNTCHKCKKPLKALTHRSLLGHCDHCRARLKRAKPVIACESDLMRQKEIVADYSILLAPDQSSYIDELNEWRLRLRAIRIKKEMSIDDLARNTNTTFELISAAEQYRAIPPLQTLLTWIRALSGSLEAFLKDPAKIDDDLSNPKVCEIWTCNYRGCSLFRSIKASGAKRRCERCHIDPVVPNY